MTSLVEEYRKQLRWRSWEVLLDALPAVQGKRVLDLGCAVGDQAALFSQRGAQVIGIDANAELLAAASRRRIPNAEFRVGDVRQPNVEPPVDGIWSSFTAAYLLDLPEVLGNWSRLLRPGGWIALTEVDDMWAHAPLPPQVALLLESYAKDGIAQGRYDFHMGGKLADYLRAAGFQIAREITLPDQEFAFSGPARPEIVAAWSQRLDRMRVLQEFCGADFPEVRETFLRCLQREDHTSQAAVRAVMATWPNR